MARLRQFYPNNYFSSAAISGEFEQIIRYITAAELGNKTVGELLSQLFDDTGSFTGPVQMRRNLDGDIEYRIGDYTDPEQGWTALVSLAELRGLPGVVVGEVGEPLISNRADYLASAGQVSFNYVHPENSSLLVWVDGLLQREGAAHDYTSDPVLGTVTFTDAMAGGEAVTVSQIRSGAVSGFVRKDIDTVGSQAVFPFIHDDGTTLNVYLNGILQREGGDFDFVTDPGTDTVTFTTAVPPGNTVTIFTIETPVARVVPGLMLEDRYVNVETGLIRLDRVQVDDDGLPQAKVDGLIGALTGKARLHVQATTPVDPQTGDLWIDTAQSPNRLKFYDGVQFLSSSPDALLPGFTTSNAGQALHVNGTGTGLEYKPVDTSTLVAKTRLGAANGVATLDSSARLPRAQLPLVLGSDTLYRQIASPAAEDYTLSRLFKQSVSIQGVAVRTGGGTCSVQLLVNGTETGSVYTASTAPNEVTLGSPVDVDALASSVGIGVRVTSPNSVTDLEISIAYQVNANA